MKTYVYTLAALASIAVASTAEAKRDNKERAAWTATVRSQSPLFNPTVVEGRNAAAVVVDDRTMGVEPYIAQQIDQNTRSSH